MQRLNAAIAVVAITAVWVGVGLPAGAAQAAVAPPPPVTLPSSVLGDLAGTATTSEAVGGLTSSGGAAVGTASSAGGGVAVVGLAVGLGVGGWAAKNVLHIDGASGNTLCDAHTLFTGSADTFFCPTSPAPGYPPNYDVANIPAGWTRAPSWTNAHGAGETFTVVQTGAGAQVTFICGSGCQDSPSFRYLSNAGAASFGTNVLGVVGSSSPWATGLYSIYQQWPYIGNVGGTVSVTLPDVGAIWAWNGASGAPYIWVSPSLPASPVHESDPTRTFVTSWLCSDGSSHSLASTPFHETSPEWPGMPAAQCDGSALSSLTISETSSSGATRTLVTWSAPASVGTLATAHPQCVGGGCQLLLYRVDATSGALLDCFSSSSVCADWWTATTSATTNTDQYRCTYGGDTVALTECTVYAHAFDPQNPTYADPRNGNAPAPTGSGEPAPSDNCPPPFSWGGLFNPWWYFQGGLCAMKAAFVPSAATSTDWQSFVGDVQTHPPVSIAVTGVQFTTTVANGVNGQGDCSTLPLQMSDHQLQGPGTFDLCAGVKAAAATTWGQAVELIITVAIIGWAAWIVAHRIGRSFGSKA